MIKRQIKDAHESISLILNKNKQVIGYTRLSSTTVRLLGFQLDELKIMFPHFKFTWIYSDWYTVYFNRTMNELVFMRK